MSEGVERPARRGHMPALDGVRGVAVLLVMAHNINAISHPDGRWTRLYDVVMGWGWVGVQVFFVLSGFLITGILLDTRRAPHYYRAFLARRALRIFPLYYAVLLVIFVVLPVTSGWQPRGSQHQIWLWTYLANWTAPFGLEVDGFTHFWSLAIEEQFYLLWPLLIAWLSPRMLLRSCVGLGIAALVTRIALVAIHFDAEGPYMFTICRVDALAAGAACAVLFRRPRLVERFVALRERAGGRLLGATLALLVLTLLVTRGAPRIGVLTQTFGYTVFALVFALMVFDAALADASQGWLARLWRAGWLRRVGRYSYAMYVFHLPLHLFVGMPLLRRALGDAAVTVPVAGGYFVLMSGVTFVAGWASYHMLERHLLRLKKYFVPSPQTAS